MNLFTRKEKSIKREYLLGGIISGIGISLFGGPIFLIGMALGWFMLFLFLALCMGTYFVVRYLINKSSILLELGGGEFWWLGFCIGFCIVILYFFLLFSLPI